MAARLTAVLLVALSLLPVAGLIPGGEDDPGYMARTVDWALGTALCVGVGALVAFLVRVRRRRAVIAPDDQPSAVPDPATGAMDRAFVATMMIGAALLYCAIATFVFSRRPLLIDEIVQVLQARWYAAGKLAVAAPTHREFFSTLHLVDLGDRVFSQFPAGGPAMLALGTLVGAEWLVGPVAGALCVGLFWVLLGTLEPDAGRRWRRSAALLFAVAPFGAFMFGSHMNHVTTLFWLLIAMVALARSTAEEAHSPWWGLLAGFALGAAASIRPVDGAAFALPAAAWLLWRARRGGRPFVTLLLSGVGIAVPLAALLAVNARTTGKPLLFGYDLLWGAGHGLGFHASPWGPLHTPWRGVELIGLYFARLSSTLFETPFPAVLLVAGGLWCAPRLRAMDRYLLATGALVLLGYWAYWHDGNYLGPRFLVPLLPALILWTARLPRALALRIGRGTPAWAGIRAGLAAAALLAVVEIAVVRTPAYRNGMTSMRLDIERESARAGIRHALVLVKESWGAQLIVRMWALGVPRSESEILYRKTDICRLERAVAALESEERPELRGAGALARLLPLLADSARVVRSTLTPDRTAGWQPDAPYPEPCLSRLADDARGWAHLAPLRLARDGNVYARWLPGREAEVAAEYPNRPVYRLSRQGPEVTAPYVWERLSPE